MPLLDQKPSLRQVQLAELLDSMPEAVFLLDNDARVLELNRAAEHFAGRLASEIRGTHIRVLGQALGLEPREGETVAPGATWWMILAAATTSSAICCGVPVKLFRTFGSGQIW